MTALAVARRVRPPVPWRLRITRLYAPFVNFSIVGLVGYGWVHAGLTRTPHAGGAWTALWLSVLGAAVLMKVVLAAGPVFAGPDRMFWVLSSPAPRAALLRPRFLVLLAVGAAVGACWPAVVSGIVGAVVPPLVAVGIGSGCGVAVVAGAVALQRVRVAPQGWLSGLAGLAVVALLVPPGWFGPQVDGGPGAVGAAWVLAIGLAVLAAASLRHLRRSDLAAGGALAGVARVSVSWFDLALLGAVVAERRARTLGRVKSVRLRGSRLVVLAWTDALRLRRTPNAALVWAALLPAPALVSLSWEGAVVPAVHLVAAFLATDRLAAGLKFVCRSPAMRRALGLPDRQLRLAHLVFPAAGAVVWCGVTAAFTPHVSVLNALISAVGAVAVTYRIATRPPIDYGAAIIDFGVLGPTPLGLIAQFSRGPVLLAVLAVVQMSL
ncbi:DUF6297 family protein [Lentzea cavernae]|uniref:DUF6297 family protein n=1 Tax=Lentzea cavernae TaxID=2020703 RepID=UPI00174BECC8|nr:DUF6297 family protein [Lentzea cavernae]